MKTRSRNQSANRRRRNPRATVLLFTLLVVAIAGALMATIARSSALRQNAQRQDLARFQALWLAEAGLARAQARYAADPAYRGETWRPPAEALAGKAGEVTITVAPRESTPESVELKAVAVWPAIQNAARPPRWRSQSTRTKVLPLAPSP